MSGSNVANVWSSLEHNYALMTSANMWRAPSQDGHQLILQPFNSNITGKACIEYNNLAFKTIIHKGALLLGKLNNAQGGDLYNVQQLWASSYPPFCALLTRFRRESNINATDPMEAPEWEPRRGSLTEIEKRLRAMEPSVTYIKGATVHLRDTNAHRHHI
jgi:hypothetical protein